MQRDPTQLVDLVRELCRQPREPPWVEFKHNKADPPEIGRYMSALANAAALAGQPFGYLIWGIEDCTHVVIGTTVSIGAARKGNEELIGWLRRSLAPDVTLSFYEFECEGKPLSLIEVPAASHRPVQFEGQEYIRVGSYTRPLKDLPELERQLWRVFDHTPFESQVAADGLTATATLAALDYPAYFRLLHEPVPDEQAAVLTRLVAERMAIRAPAGGWAILNLGAMLLARDLSEFPTLKRKTVRVVEYRGSSRVETIREVEKSEGYAAGFEGLIATLKALLPTNEVIEQALRRQVPMYPELALRELTANALIHQDLHATGTGPMIEIFENRLEITNPGTPLVEPNRFMDLPPRSRNEAVASFMRRVDICEERGSGIDKVVWQTEVYQLPAPLFEAPGDNTRVTLFAPRPFARMTPEDRLRACYWHACLQHLKAEAMTNSTLRGRFGIPPKNRAQVSRVINDALRRELIRQRDPDNASRKYASYVPYWVAP
jgi:ATP-dependent DNA helicase RecG